MLRLLKKTIVNKHFYLLELTIIHKKTVEINFQRFFILFEDPYLSIEPKTLFIKSFKASFLSFPSLIIL